MTRSGPQSAPHALVFDSGVGGLSISAAMRDRMPGLRQSYLADDAFRPYGDKPESALRARIPALLSPLVDRLSPDIVVIACNTASTTALPAIRDALSVPVVGVVPAIKPAAALSEARRIGVLGTPGTVQRDYVDALIETHAGDCEVRLRGSVALVEQAERKLRGEEVDAALVAAEIGPLFDGPRIDAVVLACTHFPLLAEALAEAAPYPVRWIDSGDAVARRVEDLLGGVSGPGVAGDRTAYLTGPDADPERRKAFARFGFTRIVPDVPAPR
ncbi:MAG: glutamate racemase [Litorimonas sp.]